MSNPLIPALFGGGGNYDDTPDGLAARIAEGALAQQVHRAAVEVTTATASGDKLAEGKARAQLAATSADYLSRGKTDDELEAAKAGGPIGQTLDALAKLLRSAAGLVLLVVAAVLFLHFRKGR